MVICTFSVILSDYSSIVPIYEICVKMIYQKLNEKKMWTIINPQLENLTLNLDQALIRFTSSLPKSRKTKRPLFSQKKKFYI